jgi:hypothetical protein
MRAMVVTETKPIWTTSSFLVYTGGLTILGGAIAGLGYLAAQSNGNGAMVAWSLLFLVILYGIALALRVADRWLAAGIFAFVSVIAWAIFLVYLFLWFGWDSVTASFGDWSFPKMLVYLLVLASASFDRMVFKFPFIRLISAVVFYLFVVDLLTSGHGNWFTWVTLFIGFLYLLAGTALGKPSAFWLHFVGGAFIGFSLLSWFHTSDFDFALILVFSLVFVLVGYATKRSSWAFYGTIGFFAATVHYVVGSPTALFQGIFGIGQQCISPPSSPGPGICTSLGPHISPWAPALAFGLLGFWLVALGMLGKPRRRRHHHGAVVITTPAPPAAATEPLPE